MAVLKDRMREHKLKMSNSSHFQTLKTVVTISPAFRGFL